MEMLSTADRSYAMWSWKTPLTRCRRWSGGEVAEVDAVAGDAAVLRVVEPAQQLDQRALAGAVQADEGGGRAGRDEQVEPA
jgi:hypothetical protein